MAAVVTYVSTVINVTSITSLVRLQQCSIPTLVVVTNITNGTSTTGNPSTTSTIGTTGNPSTTSTIGIPNPTSATSTTSTIGTPNPTSATSTTGATNTTSATSTTGVTNTTSATSTTGATNTTNATNALTATLEFSIQLTLHSDAEVDLLKNALSQIFNVNVQNIHLYAITNRRRLLMVLAQLRPPKPTRQLLQELIQLEIQINFVPQTHAYDAQFIVFNQFQSIIDAIIAIGLLNSNPVLTSEPIVSTWDNPISFSPPVVSWTIITIRGALVGVMVFFIYLRCTMEFIYNHCFHGKHLLSSPPVIHRSIRVE
jgi:acetolactate synthase regulatory subunit